jgi:hypothetical protein
MKHGYKHMAIELKYQAEHQRVRKWLEEQGKLRNLLTHFICRKFFAAR